MAIEKADVSQLRRSGTLHFMSVSHSRQRHTGSVTWTACQWKTRICLLENLSFFPLDLTGLLNWLFSVRVKKKARERDRHELQTENKMTIMFFCQGMNFRTIGAIEREHRRT